MAVLELCTIIENKKLNDFAYRLTVEANEMPMLCVPGQFVNIRCGHSRVLRRPISICHVVEDTVSVIYEVRGDGTDWLSRKEQGERLSILGPLGNGFDLSEGKLLVVGGGIGVPPLLYAARQAASSVTAVLGFRDAGRVILTDEFEERCDKVCVTTDDGSVGIKGTVAGAVEECLKAGGYSRVLACGPRVMLKAVSELCSEYNVSCQVSVEERMGCGVGACLVCACKTVEDGTEKMRRVCKDGPVFNSAEVVW